MVLKKWEACPLRAEKKANNMTCKKKGKKKPKK